MTTTTRKAEVPEVASSFEPAMVKGMWYEQAYIDIAQAGASCQTLNVTTPGTSGVVSMAFAVDYGPAPFTIIEVYTPQNSSVKG